MKPTLLLAALAAALVYVPISLFGKPAGEQNGYFTEVSEKKVNLVKIKTDDPTVDVYIDKSSLSEHSEDGIDFRIAKVLYRLSTPKVVDGKEIRYVLSEVAYQCENSLYLTVNSLLLDENADPLFKLGEIGEAESVENGSNAWYEMKYVCNSKIKNAQPKSEVKSKKYIDI